MVMVMVMANALVTSYLLGLVNSTWETIQNETLGTTGRVKVLLKDTNLNESQIRV